MATKVAETHRSGNMHRVETGNARLSAGGGLAKSGSRRARLDTSICERPGRFGRVETDAGKRVMQEGKRKKKSLTYAEGVINKPLLEDEVLLIILVISRE